MRITAGIAGLAAAAVFAVPAQAQVHVPVSELPPGTPGCTTTSPGPNGQGEVTTCAWGPVTCEEGTNTIVVAGPSHTDRCAIVLGPVEADCSSESASSGTTHFFTFSEEQCGASAGGEEVRHGCRYESMGGGGFFDEDTECFLVIGDLTCQTDPDDDGTEIDEAVGCVTGGPEPGCTSTSDDEPPATSSSTVCSLGPLTCSETSSSVEITFDYRRGCSVEAGGAEADCAETQHQGPVPTGGYGYASGTGCIATAGGTDAAAGCGTTDTVPPDGSASIHTDTCTVAAGEISCVIDRADPPASIVDSVIRCVSGED